MPSTASTQEPGKLAPFALERLIIVHENLAEISTGDSLDEGASIEELSEQILYYHNNQNKEHQQNTARGGESSDSDGIGREDSANEAIQFAGFCSGLRGFPVMVSRISADNGDASNDSDATKEVYFNKSTLVFVPLEEQFGQPIIAIAQIARSSPFTTKLRNASQQRGGANPLAIRAAIQKCHDLFCLIRGGGIHWRLLHRTNNNGFNNKTDTSINSASNTILYPEMKRLYSLRKMKRKLDAKLYRLSHNNVEEREVLEKELAETKENIDEQYRAAPMKSLRLDLQVHYDEFLSQLGVASGIGGAAGRCLVELVPTPTPLKSGAHLFQYPPATPSVRATVRLDCTIQELINRRDRSVETPDLLGISCFYQGRSICTHVLTTDEEPKIFISPTTACLLLGHMKSIEQNANINASNPVSLLSPTSASSNPSTPPRFNRALNRWNMRSLVADNYEYKHVSSTPASLSSGEKTPLEETAPIDRGFLRPPPLSMLSASDQVFEANIPSFGSAWLPRIHLPSDENPDIVTEVHTALFEYGVYSFLIYMKPHIDDDFTQLHCNSADSDSHSIENAISPMESLLELTANSVSECLQSFKEQHSTSSSIDHNASEESESLSSTRDKKSTAERGEDIIFIDREENSLTLVTHRNGPRKASNSTGGGGTSTPSNKERKLRRNPMSFLGIGRNSRIEDRSTSNLSESSSATGSVVGMPHILQWPLTGFDCRHLLTAHLPLDVILAFDDVMNEIHKMKEMDTAVGTIGPPPPKSRHRSKRERNFSCEGGGSSSSIIKREICTFLPQGWMFAHVHNNQELYVLFDADKHVTIADVQKGVARVRNELSIDNNSPPSTIRHSSASPR